MPGSSDPSGQSQKSSLTRAAARVIDGLDMQTNVLGDVKYLATKRPDFSSIQYGDPLLFRGRSPTFRANSPRPRTIRRTNRANGSTQKEKLLECPHDLLIRQHLESESRQRIFSSGPWVEDQLTTD